MNDDPEQLWDMAPKLRLAVVVSRDMKDNFKMRMHSHAFHELAFVMEGRCEWHFDDAAPLELEEGDLLLLPPERRHKEVIPPNTRSRLGWVCFDVGEKVPALCQRRIAAGKYGAEIRRIFRAVFEEHRTQHYASELRTSLLVHELLILVARLADREPSEALNVSKSRHIAEAAAQTICANLRRPIGLRELAAYHSLSVSRFAAVFRETHGVAPGRFLREERLRRGRALLTERRCSIKEIAAECGYADSAHFSHAFTAAEKCSPRDFRNRTASSGLS